MYCGHCLKHGSFPLSVEQCNLKTVYIQKLCLFQYNTKLKKLFCIHCLSSTITSLSNQNLVQIWRLKCVTWRRAIYISKDCSYCTVYMYGFFLILEILSHVWIQYRTLYLELNQCFFFTSKCLLKSSSGQITCDTQHKIMF